MVSAKVEGRALLYYIFQHAGRRALIGKAHRKEVEALVTGLVDDKSSESKYPATGSNLFLLATELLLLTRLSRALVISEGAWRINLH